MVMDFYDSPGATPIDPDEAVGLVPKHITSQAALNRKMFDKTWLWAGTFRSSNKNIGVESSQIATRLHDLLANARYQITHQVFPADELAVRFHHQLVVVHAFPNGNGRHARLMADVLITQLGGKRFTWGHASLMVASRARDDYLMALRAADQGNPESLLQFARA